MGTLNGLEGTSIKEMDCFFIRRVSEVNKVTPTLAATTAGENGALSIWMDDDNHFRCEASKYLINVDKKIFSDIGMVKDWLRLWMKKIR